MVKQPKRKKLTNKQIEIAFNNIISDLGETVRRVVTLDSLFCDFLEMTGQAEKLKDFIENKYKEEDDAGDKDKK